MEIPSPVTLVTDTDSWVACDDIVLDGQDCRTIEMDPSNLMAIQVFDSAGQDNIPSFWNRNIPERRPDETWLC